MGRVLSEEEERHSEHTVPDPPAETERDAHDDEAVVNGSSAGGSRESQTQNQSQAGDQREVTAQRQISEPGRGPLPHSEIIESIA